MLNILFILGTHLISHNNALNSKGRTHSVCQKESVLSCFFINFNYKTFHFATLSIGLGCCTARLDGVLPRVHA